MVLFFQLKYNIKVLQLLIKKLQLVQLLKEDLSQSPLYHLCLLGQSHLCLHDQIPLCLCHLYLQHTLPLDPSLPQFFPALCFPLPLNPCTIQQKSTIV